MLKDRYNSIEELKKVTYSDIVNEWEENLADLFQPRIKIRKTKKDRDEKSEKE